MNILFVSHNIYPCITGGAEVFNYNLVKALSDRYSIHLLTLCQEQIEIGASLIMEERRKFGPARISIPLQDILNMLKLRKKIDLIHITYMRDHWLKWMSYPIMSRKFNIPYVMTIHGGGMSPWKPRFPHKLLFDRASKIIAVSNRLKIEYEKRSGRDVLFIPPLVPFRKSLDDRVKLRRSHGYEESDKILLFLGSVKKIKGCDTLINAFISMGEDYISTNRLKLVIAGDGNLRKTLQETVIKHRMQSSIRFMGNISQDSVPSIFRLSDIYILPSHFEGTPISMLEAMYNRLPILGSNVVGINNIIRHEENGLLFDVSNKEDLKAKMMRLSENQEMAEELACKAEKTYEDSYSFDTVIKQYTNIYEEIGGNSSG